MLTLSKSSAAINRAPNFHVPNVEHEVFDATQFGQSFQFYQNGYFVPGAGAVRANDRVWFIPYSDPVVPAAKLLIYNPNGSFLDPTQWVSSDLRVNINTLAYGFGGAILSPDFNKIYLCAARKVTAGNWDRNTLQVEIDTQSILSGIGNMTFSTFDTTTMASPPPNFGGFWGSAMGTGIYYCCSADNAGGGTVINNYWLKYDSSGAFNNQAQWSFFDVTQGGTHPQTGGFQSSIALNGFLYSVPFGAGYSVLTRYDGTMSFTNPAAFQYFDMSLIAGGNLGWTGAISFNNRYICFVAWKNNGISNPITGSISDFMGNINYVFCLLDTQSNYPFTDTRAWQVFNVNNVLNASLSNGGNIAGGYEGGIVDNRGIAWFAPTQIYVWPNHTCVPLLGYHTALPFTNPRSWVGMPDPNYNPSTGGITQSSYIPGACGPCYDPFRDAMYTPANAPSALYPPSAGNTKRGSIWKVQFS